jgi:hypothetical protein
MRNDYWDCCADIISDLDAIEMGTLERERARRIAQTAQTLVCLAFEAARAPRRFLSFLRRKPSVARQESKSGEGMRI